MSTEEQKDIEERERLEGTEDADEEGDEELPASASGEDDGRASDDDSDAPSDDDAETRDDVSDSSSLAPTTASQSAARAAAAGAAGSAGARLAAAKAAKAAKKAARKSRETAGTGAPSGADPTKESVEALKESSFGQAAAKATDWAQTNRNLALGIFGVIVLGALGWVGFAWWGTSQAEAAGALLEDAIEIATAEIRTEDDAAAEETAPTTEEDADDAPTFTTREARSQAALEAYRRVTTEHAGSEAATWARLGEARALFDLGQMDEARAAYEQALRDAGGDPIVAWRALEGVGFTYEVAEQWAQAIEKYEELRSIEDGAYQAPADYHIARMRIAMGETVPATTMLRELVTSLRATGEDEEPEFPFVLAQAEVRLRQLDPSAVSGPSSPMMVGPEGGGELPPGLEGIDPQILEQLRRQLQQGAGAGEGE